MTLADLTPAQRQVAMLLASGLTEKEVAAILGLVPKTINVHVMGIHRRTGTHNRTQLVNLVKAEEIAALKQAIADRDKQIRELLAVIRCQSESLAKRSDSAQAATA